MLLRRKKQIKVINTPKHSRNRIYLNSGISPCLNNMRGGSRQPKVAIPVSCPEMINKVQNGRRFKNDGDISFTLTSRDRHGIYHGFIVRKLTPKECERLQGFPDDWTYFI